MAGKALVEMIWAALTEHNVACTCCDSNEAYQDKVNEVGTLIDGRQWRKVHNGERYEYRTIKPGE